MRRYPSKSCRTTVTRSQRPARDRSHVARSRNVTSRTLLLLFKEKRDEYSSQGITQ